MNRATTRARVENKPTHVSKGNVLDDLGFSPSQASALKLKAEVLSAILDEIDARQYTAKDLVERLDEYQPQVSNLMRGKISKMSLEKLLAYCDRLGIGVTIDFQPATKNAREAYVDRSKRTRAKLDWPTRSMKLPVRTGGFELMQSTGRSRITSRVAARSAKV